MKKTSRQVVALRDAVYAKDLAAVEKALKKVPDADAEPVNMISDRSVLMAAIASDAPLPIIAALVERGHAKPTYTTAKGETPISVAQEKQRKDVIDYFQGRGHEVAFIAGSELPQEEKDRRFAKAVMDWTSDALATRLSEHLANGASPATLIWEDYYALHYLCRHGVKDRAAYRVLLDAKVPLVTKSLRTPLHVLAEDSGEAALVGHFAGAVEVDAVDGNGNTALLLAVKASRGQDSELVDALVAAGADPARKNKRGKAPLDFAKGKLKQRWDASAPGGDPATTALLAAISKNDVSGVTAALAAGGNPNLVDTTDQAWGPHANTQHVAPVHLACVYGIEQPVFDAVMAHPGVDVNVKSEEHWTPLHYVMAFAQSSPWRLRADRLFALGANPNAKADDGTTALFRVRNLHRADDLIAAFDYLVQHGANPKVKDASGETILDQEAEWIQRFSQVRSKPDFVRYLVHLVANGVKARSHKAVLQWLATTGARYADVSAVVKVSSPGAQAREAAARQAAAAARFAEVTGGALAPLTGARTTLRLHGETKDVALFDWFALLQQGDADENELADEIMNNQIDVERIPDVETFAWIPFGIVGMTGALETYDEMGVEGTLYLRLDRAEGGDAPVVFEGGGASDDEPDRALRFRALWQTLEKP